MIRISALAACLCCIVGVFVAFSRPQVPLDVAAKRSSQPAPRFTDQDITRKAVALSGLLTKGGRPVRVSVSPRNSRDRSGATGQWLEAESVDENGQVICFACWDPVSGRVVMFSRNNLRGLPHNPSTYTRSYAAEAARNWLTMTDLNNGDSRWRVTEVVSKPGRHWIAHGEDGTRRASVFVDRLTGAVVSLSTSERTDLQRSQIAESRGGTVTALRRNIGKG